MTGPGERLEVVSPEGERAVARVRRAPRLASLQGKTLGEVWNGVFKGDLTFPLIRTRLAAQYPGLKVIPYTEFPHVPGNDDPAQQRMRAAGIAKLVREKACDAVVSGNGA